MTVTYKDGIQLQLLPALRTPTGIRIADGEQWSTVVRPKRFANKLTDINRSNNNLVVPVIKNADQKGIVQIAKEMSELAGLAREGKLKPDQMQGGCFSISSLGGIGGTYFTPIINAPEVSILGVCRSSTRPVWDGKAFQPRLILPLSLSWDHRVIDGAAAARFNAYFASLLADFRRVLL